MAKLHTMRQGPALPSTWPEGAPPGFHLLAKPSGAVCNLDCTYCYFLSKESLNPAEAARMPEDVLHAYIEQVIASHREPEVAIAFQGGEPTLLGVDFYRRAVAHARAVAGPGRPLAFSLQTNGTLLDDEWGAFLRDNRVLVGLSVDGPRAMHDAYRKDKRGSSTFDRVMRGAEVLRRHGVEMNVLCSVHAGNAGSPLEVYRFFRDEMQAKVIQLIPIVERATDELIPVAELGWGKRAKDRPLYRQAGARVTSRSVTPAQWGDFLIRIFDEWISRDVGETFVTIFDAALASWLGALPVDCVFRPTCGDAPVLEPNGDVYTCDHYVEPGYKLGNLLEDHLLTLLASPRQREFGLAKQGSLPAYCKSCDVLFACNGECPRNRFTTTPDGQPGLNYLCQGYRAFFRHVARPMRIMADLLERGRYADEIMTLLATDTTPSQLS